MNTLATAAPATPPIAVLSLGANDFFVARLYREMRRRWPALAFVVSDYCRYGTAVDFAEDEAFAGHVQTPRGGFDRATALGLLRAIGQRHLYHRLRAAAFFRGWPFTREALGHAARAAQFEVGVLRERPFALWHFHFCSVAHLAFADVRPAGTRMICSFWGSDLLRAPDAETQWHVRRVVRAADAITVQSPELREIVLSLYGRDLAARVHACRFPLQVELLDQIDRLPRDAAARAAARDALGIPDDARVIAVGNNGSPANQQAAVIEQLATLPAAVRATLFLLFHHGYGGSAVEAEALEHAARARGFRCHIDRRFLDWAQLAALRAAADVTIHVPVSDALSHLIVEALYAGSCVITGAWLPYGPYRRDGLSFREVETLADLPAAVTAALGERAPDPVALAALRARIRTAGSAEALVPAWIRLYQDVLGGTAPRG